MDKSIPAKAKTVTRRSKEYNSVERRCPNCLNLLHGRVTICPNCGQTIKQWWVGRSKKDENDTKGNSEK